MDETEKTPSLVDSGMRQHASAYEYDVVHTERRLTSFLPSLSVQPAV